MYVKCACGRLKRPTADCRCGRKHAARQNKGRKTAHERGYTYQWQQYRKRLLANNPLCVKCEDRGDTTPAIDIDHIQRPSDKDDPLFWDMDNHMPLCKACHELKTQTERKVS